MMQMAAMMPYASPQMGLQQAMGEQLAGSFTGGLSTVGSGLARIGGYGALGAAGLSMLGMGGMGMAALGGLPGMAVVGGLEAGAYGLNQMHAGFQERQNVNRVLRQRFGGMMGIGGGRGGMGFNTQEMGQVSSMVRGMADQDMYTSFDELTRLMDRTAQMGLYRGVQGARQFQTRFKETVASLTEIAKTMHTSLEGATQFFEQARGQGFFSGRDITATLTQTRMAAGASGMSMDQMMAIRNQGTQMGRMMGMRGRTGAGAMMQMATNIGVGMQTGAISDELISEATGGLMGAEGAQAAAGMMMQSNARWMRRGAGRVMLAGLWDPASGGINRERLAQVMAGGMSFQDIRAMGRANISGTGGRRSEFFANEERLGGMLQEAGGGALQFGMLEEHIRARRGVTADDPIGERFMRRQTGWSQAEFELQRAAYRNLPRILEDRSMREAQQNETAMRTRSMEGRGVAGAQRRIQHWWQTEVTSPIRQMGDDLVTSFTTKVDEIFNQMEGNVKITISERTKNLLAQYAESGERGKDLMSFQRYQELSRKLRTTGDEGGFWGGVGRSLGMRSRTIDERFNDIGGYLYSQTGKGLDIGAKLTQKQKEDFVNKYSQDIQMGAGDFGFTTDQMTTAKTRVSQILMSKIGTGMPLQQFRSQREAFGSMTGTEKDVMFQKRLEMYWSDPVLGPMLKKAQGRAQQYAVLREVESGMGRGIALPVDEMGGGQSYETLQTRLKDAARQEQALMEKMAGGLLGKGYGESWAYVTRNVPIAGAGAFGKTQEVTEKIGGKALRELRRLENMVGSAGGDETGFKIESRNAAVRRYAGSLASVMSNETTRGLMIDAAKGVPGALQELQKLSALDKTSAASAGIQDVQSLGILTQQIANGNKQLMGDIATLSESSNLRDMLSVAQRVSESGRALGRSVRNNVSISEAALKVDPGTMAALEKIAEVESTGNWDAANELRRKFYSDYVGKPGAEYLAAALAADPTGAATNLGVGMQRASRLEREFTGKRGIERGLSAMLQQEDIGLDESAFGGKAFEALGRNKTQRMKKLMGMLTSKEGMTAEQLTGFLGTEGAVGKIGGMGAGRFAEEVTPWLTRMKDGLEATEARELAVGEGAEEAQRGSLGGPQSRQSLAEKQYDILKRMFDFQVIQSTKDSGLIKEQTDALVAAMGLQSKIGDPNGVSDSSPIGESGS